MAQGTPEQAKAGVDAWTAWAASADKTIVDLGAPLQSVIGGEGKQITGFSIMEADSAEALQRALDGHPRHHMPGGAIHAYEFVAIPGM